MSSFTVITYSISQITRSLFIWALAKATQCISHRWQGINTILENPYQGDTCIYELNVLMLLGSKDGLMLYLP
jgi:hypothetical protein